MIKGKQIENLAGGQEKGQIVTFIVKAIGNIIPTVVLNVYVNLECSFVQILPALEKNPNQIQTLGNKQGQMIPMNNFIFATPKENFEKIFGPYSPAKVLHFELPKKEG